MFTGATTTGSHASRGRQLRQRPRVVAETSVLEEQRRCKSSLNQQEVGIQAGAPVLLVDGIVLSAATAG